MKYKSLKKNQKGVVLLLTMIIVMALMFSGLFVTGIAYLGAKIVNHDKERMKIYHEAYSEIQAQMEYINKNPNIISSVNTGPVTLSPIIRTICNQVGDICSTVTLRYLKEVIPAGGYSVNLYKSFLYELIVHSEIKGLDTSSEQRLNFTYLTYTGKV